MTDSPDQTIVIKYIADAQDAIAKQKEFEEATKAVKAQLKELAAQTGATYKSMSQAMVTSKAGELMAKAFPDKEQMAKATSEIRKYEAVMASALAQVNAEVRNTSTIWATGSRNIAQSQKAEAQAVQQAQKQEADAKRAATQAWLKDNQQQANAMKYLASETKKGADQTKSSFSTMAVAMGAALGISAVTMVRNFFQSFINYAKEAIQVGYEFTKGLYQLNVGVNALRRAGTEITFGEVTAQLQKLKSEFGIFATKDLVVGAGAFLNLNRDMGFTKEQLFELQEAIATLAVVNGRSMDEVQKTVALALSSGYTEGLQRLGVSINRVTIAEEAARLGWDKGYTALTEQQRALATYNLVLRKTSVYSDDLLSYQETLPGAIDTATAALTDQSAIIGESLLPAYVKLLEIWVNIVKAFRVDIQFGTGLAGVQEKAIADREAILGRELTTWEKITEKFKAGADYAAAVINNALYGIPMPSEMMIPEAPVIPQEVPALTDDQIEAVESINEKILDLQADYDNDRRDLAIDLQRDLAEIEQDGADKIAEIMADHAQKMLDIANKASDQIRDAQLRYDLDVQQAWDEYYSNLASAAESHGNKLLKIEEDYQEKLKRLKEGFLLDLEDALHERDARQVLRLIRQYNLDRTQATRERDNNLRDEARAYEEQLHELDRQRRERLKKLQQELDLRLRMLAIQTERELEEERIAYKRKTLEQVMQNKKDRVEREAKNKEDLDALKLHLEDRLKLIAEDMAGLGITTAAGMKAVTDIMNTYVGPGGVSDSIMNYFMSQIRAVIATMSGLSALSAAIPETRFTNPNQPGFASGGMAYANKPTTALFGEGGPEVALFLPLSKLLSGSINNRSELPSISKSGGGDKGRLQVEVLLGAGLEGRIVDKTLNNVANVVLRSIRQ